MIKLLTVSDCPMTRKSTGIVRMTPELISALATAVQDKDEWAIVLTGERKDRGYDINVTGYFIPDQDRSGGHVDVKEFDLDLDVVGVIHSHNSMGAFFSSIDTATLNPRFPMSIVVAQAKNAYLGFSYLGTGKVVLPCGGQGEIEFKIQPTVGPVLHEAVEVAHNKADLGKCPHHENQPSDEFHYHAVARCGLSEPEALLANAFGKNDTLLNLVAALPRYQGGFSKHSDSIANDPDSHWCNNHQDWDFCEFKEKKRLKCPTCSFLFLSNTTSADGKLHCPTCKKDITPIADGGWLAKYEQLFRESEAKDTKGAGVGGKKRSAKKGEPLEPELIECLECEAWDEFKDYQCSVCLAPYCIVCGLGHDEGKCPDQECVTCEEYQIDCTCETGFKGDVQPDGCVIVI